jgi:hypothetical protein
MNPLLDSLLAIDKNDFCLAQYVCPSRRIRLLVSSSVVKSAKSHLRIY